MHAVLLYALQNSSMQNGQAATTRLQDVNRSASVLDFRISLKFQESTYKSTNHEKFKTHIIMRL